MISKNFLIYIVLYISEVMYTKVLADDVVDCTGTELVTSVFNDPIELNFQGIIKIYPNVTINNILSTSNNEFDVTYLDARLQTVGSTKNLIIFTTENFTNYAREQTAARITLKIDLGCDMGKERIIVFFQPFKEGNYFSPIFSQPLYELTLPTPIFAGFEITAFIDIAARDDDLTNNQINFTSLTSSQHHVRVGTKNVTSDDKKTYFANLTLERIFLELPQQIEFVIIATDNGIPRRSSNASVIIRPDTQRTLPLIPKFVQNLYKGFINVAFAMEPLIIQLTPGTYEPQVKIELKGPYLEGFNMMDMRNGTIKIQWDARKVSQTYIMTHKQWQLEVTAEHPKLTEVSVASILVELANFQSYFHFMSMYYDGHIQADSVLHMPPVMFYPFAYKPDINFTLLENPFDMFSLANRGFRLNVLLRSNFSLNAFANSSFIKLTIQASWQQLLAVSYIVIELPPPRNAIAGQQQQQMVQFEKALYVGNISVSKALRMESIVLLRDANANQSFEFQLIGEWSHLFRLNVRGSQGKLEIDLILSHFTDINWKSPILLELQAANAEAKASTGLVINTPQREGTPKSGDVFKTSTVMGKMLLSSGTQLLSMDPIILKSQDNMKDYEFGVNEREHFGLKTSVNNLQMELILKAALPNKTLDENHFLILTVTAKLKGALVVLDTLTVFIELPQKECSELSNTPIFTSGKFVYTTYVNETASLGFVNAQVKGKKATLKYMLEMENDTLAQSLSVNPFSGQLFLYRGMPEGSYKFNLTAENVANHEKSYVKALLKVQVKEECKIYQGPTVEQTVVVKHIDEERRYHGLWNMTYTANCTYRIMEIWPKEKAYIYVNKSSNMLDTLAVDREDRVFKDMYEAEIIVKLALTCDDKEDMEDTLTKQDSMAANNMTPLPRAIIWPFAATIYTQNISFAPDIMWLHLKIDDINDNAPHIDVANGPQYFAYPSGNTALDVYPEYLTQIVATDRDLGLNAKIRFSIRDNDFFAIEPETGKIYPKGGILSANQQTELIILAVDQDGKGLMSGTVLIVKGLSANYYSLVTLEGNTSKSMENITRDLSAEMGFDVKILKMSYVPQAEASAARANGKPNVACKAWIYAYRDQELVPCKELQDKFLGNSPIPNIVSIQSYEEAAALQTTVKQKTPSNVGLIAAIGLLSVISCSSIGFIIWRFYNNNGEAESASSTKGTSSIDAQCCGNGQSAEENSSSGDKDANHVKFTSFDENAKVEEMCKTVE